MVDIHVPAAGEKVTRETFHYRLRVEKFQQAEILDGHYLLRTSLKGESPEVLWRYYMQLTEIEAAFKTLKSDLAIRRFIIRWNPAWRPHLRGLPGVLSDGHADATSEGLRPRPDTACGTRQTRRHSDDRREVPTTDGRILLMPRYTQPSRITRCSCSTCIWNFRPTTAANLRRTSAVRQLPILTRCGEDLGRF